LISPSPIPLPSGERVLERELYQITNNYVVAEFLRKSKIESYEHEC